MNPSLPYRENERLQALHSYQILDTLPEEPFDKIVSKAAALCNTPIAAFTLVDENRQWFKSRIGLDIQEIDRAVSFCAHAVANNAPLVVEDASKDPTFVNHPLVVGSLRIAFYAGFPVRSASGEPIGALCVIDHFRKSLPWSKYESLTELARQIEVQLELRQQSATQ